MDQASESSETFQELPAKTEVKEDQVEMETNDDNNAETCEPEPSPKRLNMEVTSPNKVEKEGDSMTSPSSSTSPDEIRKLKDAIKVKEEELRKLEQVQYYRNKWSKEELKALIDQWKTIAMTSFEDLYEKTSTCNSNVTREALLQHLQVDPKIIDLDMEVE